MIVKLFGGLGLKNRLDFYKNPLFFSMRFIWIYLELKKGTQSHEF